MQSIRQGTVHCEIKNNNKSNYLSALPTGILSEVKVAQSCPTLCDPMDCPWNSPGQNTGVLQGIFSTQGSNPGILHCRWILYHLSYQDILSFSANLAPMRGPCPWLPVLQGVPLCRPEAPPALVLELRNHEEGKGRGSGLPKEKEGSRLPKSGCKPLEGSACGLEVSPAVAITVPALICPGQCPPGHNQSRRPETEETRRVVRRAYVRGWHTTPCQGYRCLEATGDGFHKAQNYEL